MPGSVQLVVPGLFDLPLGEFEPGFVEHELPALNRLLRLATHNANDLYSLDRILRRALGLSDAPALPLAAAFDDAADAARTLLCRAVHLRADLQQALIWPIETNQKNLDDIAMIINDLNELFKAECHISVIADGLYFMRLHEFDAPTHYPHLLSVLGKPVNPYIEQSREVLPWYRLLNEVQMFMHQHEVNLRRAERLEPTINSLWLWGAGRLPQIERPYPGWYCDDPVLNRFAERIGLNPHPLAELARGPAETDSIATDLRLLASLKAGAATDLANLLEQLESDLFVPLLAWVEAAHGRLLLRAGFASDFSFGRGAALRFWRRPRSLADWAGNS